MVKGRAAVEAKMKDRISTAGKYLKEGLEAAPDPVEIILADAEKKIGKMVAGVAEAQKTGAIKAGFEKAKKRGSWRAGITRAGSHYEERAKDMVEHAMDDYDARASAIKTAQEKVKDMPTTTRAQRIAKSKAYQEAVGLEFDKVYGRKEGGKL